MSVTVDLTSGEQTTDAASAEPAVSVVGLEVDYGAGAVLAGVDLAVERGEILGLLGPSGCGKTTLLRSIAGFLRPALGTVTLAGRTVAGPGTYVAPEHRNVGLVPQEGALFPHLDVAGNIAFGLNGVNRRDRAARVAECLQLVGLPGLERRKPRELSGGQQQRVAVARALAAEPSVVLLDEPFSALDAALRAQVREDVREVLRAAGATAILVTHDQEEALSFADRVAVLRDGRIAQIDDPATLYRRPVDLEVGRFVGEAVILDGTREQSSVSTELGLLDVSDAACATIDLSDQVVVLVRPEQVEMVPRGSSGSVLASVEAVTYFGHDALLRLRTETMRTEVLCRTTRDDLPPVGDRVGLVVHGEVSVFPTDDDAAGRA